MNQVVLFGDSIWNHPRPLGIYLLASKLRNHGFTVKPIWAWNNQISEMMFYILCKQFISKETLVVGISASLIYDYNDPDLANGFFGLPFEKFEKRIQLIKAIAPDCKIVVGGSQLTYSNIAALKERKFIDIFVKGQGEESIVEIVKSIVDNKRLTTSSIAPVVVTDQNYPYNNFANDETTFEKSDIIMPGEGLGLEFARGCVFRCSYCSYDLNGKSSGDYTKHFNAIYNQLLKNYEQHGVKHYYIVDDLINDSQEKVDLIYEVSQKLPFKFTYGGYIRLDLLRRFPDMAEKLKESGLLSCFMGVETINDKSGKAVGKGLGKERTTEALEICSKSWNNNVLVWAGFILGLPFDNEDTKYELLEWLNTPLIKSVITDISPSPLYLSPALGISEIDKNPEKFGYIDNSDSAADFLQRYITSHMQWKNVKNNYTFTQAALDSSFVLKEFQKNKKYKERISAFGLPYMLSLSEHKQEILDTILRDKNTLWPTDKEWRDYLLDMELRHKKNYYNTLLTVR